MPSEPIRERILQDLLDALAGIDGQGDYWTAVRTAARSQIAPSNLDSLPAVHVAEGTEQVVQEPVALVTRILPVIVRAWIQLPADESVELATLQNRLHADIERAVMADDTRGGLAIDTRLDGSRILDDLEPNTVGAFEVDFLIRYRTTRTDPALSL